MMASKSSMADSNGKSGNGNGKGSVSSFDSIDSSQNCFQCSEEGKSVTAVSFCTDCEDNLCKNCAKKHEKLPGCPDHLVVSITKKRTTSAVATDKCKSHPYKVLDHFCKDHDVVCCATCVAVDHHACEKLFLLRAFAQGIKESKELSTVKRTTKMLSADLQQMKATKQEQLKKLETERNDNLKAINELRETLVKRIDDLVKMETISIKTKHKRIKDKIMEELNSVDDMKKMAENCIKKISEFKGDNDSQLFIYMKSGEKLQNKGNKLLIELMKSDEQKKSVKFLLNKSIERYLFCLKSLGHFTDVDKVFTARFNGEYNIKTEEDKHDCDIISTCQLYDGTMMLTDWNNEQVKHLDTSYKIIGTCDMQTGPIDICCTGLEECAVTLMNTKKVQFMSVSSGSMKLTRSFSVDGFCRGISYLDGELFICFSERNKANSGQIGVYSLSGVPLHTISSPGPQIFSVPWHITTSPDGKKIHVADEDRGVITIDRYGKVLSTFADTKLVRTQGVCSPDGKTVLACGFFSHNVMQFGSDGRKLATILREADGIKGPRGLCFDRTNRRIVVNLRESNVIKAWDLL